MNKIYDAFIIHASAKSEAIAGDLFRLLKSANLKIKEPLAPVPQNVSLTDYCASALKEATFGILIINEDLLSRKFREQDYYNLLNLKSSDKTAILPVYFQVARTTVEKYSITLANINAFEVSLENIDETAEKLSDFIRKSFVEIQESMAAVKAKHQPPVTELKLSELHRGPKLKTRLPPRLVNRIKSYYYSVGIHFRSTLEETVGFFQLEIDPEREIQIWERINVKYIEFKERENITKTEELEEIALQLLKFTFGQIKPPEYLSQSQTESLYDLWMED